MEINFIAVFFGAVASMVIGSVWYGPLFGRRWMELNGGDPNDIEKCKEMQKEAMPLYLVQFGLSLVQLYVLAHFVAAWKDASGVETSLWIWLGFVMPTVAGLSMWNSQPGKTKWALFLLSAGYQLLSFIAFGLILSWWQ